MKIEEFHFGEKHKDVALSCVLLKTTKRITFEIDEQIAAITNNDPLSMTYFKASNGYEIISEHRMDIQSRRVWLKGASNDEPAKRSGTLALPTQDMCDETFPEFINALEEFAYHCGFCVKVVVVR